MANQPPLSSLEQEVFDLAVEVLEAPDFEKVRTALQAGTPMSATLAGMLLQVDPGLPYSGMTNFIGSGFYLGRASAESEQELQKTVFHEVYRLRFGKQAGGVAAFVDAELARVETEQAADFADRALALCLSEGK